MLRKIYVAFVAPLVCGYQTGHIQSAILSKAVSKRLTPIPWYTRPAIDFLEARSFDDKNILEIGGGQSTFWWSRRSNSVTTFDESKKWIKKIQRASLKNVQAYWIDRTNRIEVVKNVLDIVAQNEKKAFDVIVIDGLERAELVVALSCYLAPSGLLICDNSDGYGFFDATKDFDLLRIDFSGVAPGVRKSHVTSIFSNSPHDYLATDIPIREAET